VSPELVSPELGVPGIGGGEEDSFSRRTCALDRVHSAFIRSGWNFALANRLEHKQNEWESGLRNLPDSIGFRYVAENPRVSLC
jgi:hypothetical protein